MAQARGAGAAAESKDKSPEEPRGHRVLARKYRPQDFRSLIGQEVTVKILSQALDSDRLAQSFLLCGVRGTGKTTTARIIAKALNCSKADEVDSRPCGKCDDCSAITADRHEDVLEIDAASNRSIDDIREIINQVAYKPLRGRYKVYIIDEVHMLTPPAFNAILKTLEEPPDYVKFIFATTAAEKIPKTVLSRCQRFDFKRVATDEISSHLAEVSRKEGAAVEKGALELMAKAAAGSLRDGLSLLDTAIAGSEGKVTAELAAKMIGAADPGKIPELFDLLMLGKGKETISLFSELYDGGGEPEVILAELLELCGRLLRFQMAGEKCEEAEMLSGELSPEVLHRVWQLLLKGAQEVESASLKEEAAKVVLLRVIYGHGLASRREPTEDKERTKDEPQKLEQTMKNIFRLEAEVK